MGKYTKKFDTHTDYSSFISGSEKCIPNVSLCDTEKELHFTKWNGIIATYNVTTTSATTILYSTTNITEMYVDGIRQPSVSTTFKFATTGTHIVRYTLSNITTTGTGRMFYGVISVNTIKLSNTIKTLGSYTFYNCGVTKIELSDINSVDSFTFQASKKLTSIGIKGSGASVEIPNTMTIIPYYGFGGCTGLRTVVLHKNITVLYDNAFSGCTGLTSFTLLRPTPPTYRTGALNNTNNCPIYVPAGSVATYKAASGWSALADRIQAIP